jgi:hypothetical protein
VFPDWSKTGNAAAGHRRPDAQLSSIVREDIELRDLFDIHHQSGASAVLLYLGDQVRAASQRPCFAISPEEQVYRFL